MEPEGALGNTLLTGAEPGAFNPGQSFSETTPGPLHISETQSIQQEVANLHEQDRMWIWGHLGREFKPFFPQVSAVCGATVMQQRQL